MIPLRVLKGSLWVFWACDLWVSIDSMTVTVKYLKNRGFRSRNRVKPENTIIWFSICFRFKRIRKFSKRFESGFGSAFSTFFDGCLDTGKNLFWSLGKWNWLIRFLDGPLPMIWSHSHQPKKHMVMRQTGKLDFSRIKNPEMGFLLDLESKICPILT